MGLAGPAALSRSEATIALFRHSGKGFPAASCFLLFASGAAKHFSICGAGFKKGEGGANGDKAK
jgi:hypothetical protein